MAAPTAFAEPVVESTRNTHVEQAELGAGQPARMDKEEAATATSKA